MEKKLKGYDSNFALEYNSDLGFLKSKMGLDNLPLVDNSNKKLILFSGIPGAGKTTLAHGIQKNIPKTILLRGHDIVDFLELYGKKINIFRQRLKKRGFIYPDPWYISYYYQERLTEFCLNLGYNVIFDDHIRTRNNRMDYYALAKRNRAKIVFIQINAPFNIYMEREEDEKGKDKLKFLANFILQSEDFSMGEQRKYSKIFSVDGTLSVEKIVEILTLQLKKLGS